jgi:hypothetical protein
MDDSHWVVKWLAPICAGGMILVFALYYSLFGGLNLSVRDFTYLVLWGSSSLVLSVVMLWCFGISVLVLRRHGRLFDRRDRRVWVFMGLVVTAVMLWMLLSVAGFVAGTPSDAILRPFFERRPDVYKVVTGANLVGIPLSLLLLMSCVAISRGVSSSGATELGERIRWFRMLLYSAGAFLAALIYEVFRLYQWAASLGADGGSPKPDDDHTGLASSLTLAHGLIFSGFMALVFLPTAIQLDRREDHLVSEAASADPKFDRARWALLHRIEESPLTALGSYVAVLLPLITGLLTKVLEAAD